MKQNIKKESLEQEMTEVLDNEELLESECTDEESNGDSTEIE